MGLVGKPRTCRLTTEVRGAAELKRETYMAYLSCETPQAADSYWKAKYGSWRSSGCQGGGHLVWVAEAVQQLCSSEALGIDEISPGYPRALDVIRQSWLTRQWNSTWTSGGVSQTHFRWGLASTRDTPAPPWPVANYVVLLASPCTDLQLSLEKMRISPSKTEAMVLCWKKVECSLQVWRKALSQLKYFGGLFKSGGHMVRKLYREHRWKWCRR